MAMHCDHQRSGQLIRSRQRPAARASPSAGPWDVLGEAPDAAEHAPEDDAVVANTAAGIVVMKYGTATVSPKELSAALRSAGPA